MARAASQNDPLAKVYVIGAPGPIGGASTELWHTLRLWRSYGVDVVVVPTWEMKHEWRQKCGGIGCTVCQPESRGRLLDVPGVGGALIVSFCNKLFLENAAVLKANGCRTVWVNCMTWMFDEEHRVYERHGLFDHYVFQTEYQQSQLVPHLKKHGYHEEQGSVIRGAFCVDEFPFHPLRHQRGAPFVIGRISRGDAEKYSADTWALYGRIPHVVRARVMAWNRRIRRKLGDPPDWADCLPVGAETSQEFFGKLHCMLQVNGGARENWPRSGLEAMACGVPVVAENRWGWPEMLRHGETGYLYDNDEEAVFYTSRLACDEQHRMELVTRARFVLETELADPGTIWAGWRRLFRSLGAITTAPDEKELHHV